MSLTAITLFNPNVPNISHTTAIRLKQQLYIYLLQRYLLLKYRSESESQTRLQNLMIILNEFKIVNSNDLTKP
ncbi:unnamed protein product [Medioppia subpectinata]|uniref:Uncharacterized protein n=1 Tax=Medioppia subpectinata TaxID=1979941 RepID=A0A7R9KCC4_9ACAR|nr:unnamed protein product [Medioppia subpectinata]CAG2100862.1 unnamed protein product [Medioppia subpectinata]